MTRLKYPVIKSREQYNLYCNTLESLLAKPQQTAEEEEETELLTTLIEVWDQRHGSVTELDPVQLLRSFIRDHKLKPLQVMKIMGISSRGHLYEVLNYRKGLSKGVIRKLAAYFKVSQEAFNRDYALKSSAVKAKGQRSVNGKAVAKKQAGNKRISKAKPKLGKENHSARRKRQLM